MSAWLWFIHSSTLIVVALLFVLYDDSLSAVKKVAGVVGSPVNRFYGIFDITLVVIVICFIARIKQLLDGYYKWMCGEFDDQRNYY